MDDVGAEADLPDVVFVRDCSRDWSFGFGWTAKTGSESRFLEWIKGRTGSGPDVRLDRGQNLCFVLSTEGNSVCSSPWELYRLFC